MGSAAPSNESGSTSVKRRFIGSEDHKRLFCDVFLETHVRFEPSDICWPSLDADSLVRLKSLPVWDEAVRTEAETALKVQTLGQAEPDPVLSRAIALQGYEEGRHAELLRLLTAHYGIPVRPFPPPRPPSNPVWAFLSTGYGECLDSFFAFGLFEIGRRSQYFPTALTDIFDPILQEEARHILFIVNWAAYLRARQPLAARPAWDLRRIGTIAGQLAAHVRHGLRVGRKDADSQEGFTMNARSAFEDLSARQFLEICLAENDRRLARYDARLLRPTFVPAGVRLALKFPPRGEAPRRPASGGDAAWRG